MRSLKTTRRWPMVPILAMAAAGCVDERHPIGPPGSRAFDAERIAASIFSLRFAPDNLVVAQVRTISEALGLTTPAANAVARSRVAAWDHERGEREALRPLRFFKPGTLERAVANRAAARAQGQSVPLFPINFLGKTFIYDPGINGYVEIAASGAPANGIRFEIYTLDLSTRLPALPLRPVGFVDLIDQSNATSTRLRVRAVDTTGPGSVLLADYFVDGAFSSLSGGVAVSLISSGFVRDVNGRFDFSLDDLLTSGDAVGVTEISSVHRVISAEGTDVRLEVEGDVANDGSHSDLVFRMDIDGSAGVTLVDLGVVDGFQDGEIRHGGRLQAIVGGTVSQPRFDPAQGGSFTLAELRALDEILFGIDDVLLLAFEAFAPLAELFGVG